MFHVISVVLKPQRNNLVRLAARNDVILLSFGKHLRGLVCAEESPFYRRCQQSRTRLILPADVSVGALADSSVEIHRSGLEWDFRA